MQIARELKQEVWNITPMSDETVNQQVKLKLYRPRHYSKSPSLQDLLELQQRCPLIKSFSLPQREENSEETIILNFQTVDDAMDFKEQTVTFFTYSMALFETQDESINCKAISLPCQPSVIERQIISQGFCLRNGRVSLKKQTSVEDLIKENCIGMLDEQSTIVQTQRKISICEEIDKQIQNNEFEQNEEEKNHKQSYFKSIFDGVLVTGAIYGGFKLLKYLIKI